MDINYSSAAAVTPSDATVLSGVQGIYIGGAGNLAVMPYGSSTAVTFIAPPVGTVLRLRVSKVMATNTTATNIVALF